MILGSGATMLSMGDLCVTTIIKHPKTHSTLPNRLNKENKINHMGQPHNAKDHARNPNPFSCHEENTGSHE